MKMNKKIIVSTLALAMGAALAGSVSGTVAWFQYSTRAQAAYVGTTAHCSEMLEIQATAVDGNPTENGWKTELSASDIADAYSGTGSLLAPITAGAIDKTDALPDDLYSNPIYQHFAYSTWQKATVENYVQFDLHLRVKDINTTEAYLAKDVYLQDLSIVSLNAAGDAEDTTSDLYKAVRVHFAYGSSNALFACDKTSTSDIQTSVSANLDLNNDGEFDSEAAYSEWQTSEVKPYGGDEGDKQVAYNVKQSGLFADDSDPTLPSTKIGSLGSLGATTTSANVKITVTIWFEGWQELDADADVAEGVTDNAQDAQVWDPATYVAKKFGVGMRFVVPAHTAAQ